METNKKYWLRFGVSFFVIFFLIFLYASSIVDSNVMRVQVVGESPSFTIIDAISYLPGISILGGFALAGMGGLLIGSLLLSLLYGVAGSLVGFIYGKIKRG